MKYRIRNWYSELQMLKVKLGVLLSHMLGAMSAVGLLSATIIRADGSRINVGVLGMRAVTDTGVAFLVDDWDDGTTSITTMNYHDSGTGVVAENQTDTGMGTQAGPTTRATGVKTQPSANILQSVGTISYTGSLAITEHGLFDQAAQGGTLWDRTKFAAINVESGDSIEFTYQCTLTAGS